MSYTIPSAYELACGACAKFEANDIRVRLHREGGVYHVAAFDGVDKKYIKAKCFHTLAEAKTTFKRYARIAAI